MSATSAFATGLVASGALIVAIGAQNAFVLRQGLAHAHVGAVVAFCAVADALLIAAGVAGAGGAIRAWPALEHALTAAGAAFLALYAMRAFARALRPGTLAAAPGGAMPSRRAVLVQAAGFTLLNPHVYLDTVLLLGAIGAQHPPGLRVAFVAGGATASAAWFCALGYGARALAPWFARPGAWRVLEALVGATMLAIATGLAWRLARG